MEPYYIIMRLLNEEEIDFHRLYNWIRHFEMRPFGLSVKQRGEWQIPDDERGLHASGHACGGDLLHIAQEIKPEILIPVHSEQPDFYVDHLEDRGIRITLPVIGEPIKI